VDAPPPPIQWQAPEFILPASAPVPKISAGKVVVITDALPEDINLSRMLELFERRSPMSVDRINLHELQLDGGCRGCFRCSDGDPCQYKDQYQSTFNERVRSASVIIHAGRVRDRYLSSRHKLFMDRIFHQGHRPILQGKLMGFIISGPLSQLAPLRETLEAFVEVQLCHRLGIVTDETATAAQQLESMAQSAWRWVEHPWFIPPTFLGVGGWKILRDVVYTNRGVLSADHRYYVSHGLYDFPQRQIWLRLFNRGLLLVKKSPLLRKRVIKFLCKERVGLFKGQLLTHRLLRRQFRGQLATRCPTSDVTSDVAAASKL